MFILVIAIVNYKSQCLTKRDLVIVNYRMNEWMNGRMNGWMDGPMEG